MRSSQHGDGLVALASYLVVIGAFLCLALCITAAGTARFALALGYSEGVGYVVGGVFELGKWVLPTLVMSRWHAGAKIRAALIGVAWLVLVTYSALATHATVSTAIASRERMGTWQMETRSGTQSELAGIERQLAALSAPKPPRPVVTVREALVAENVPAGVWRGSSECRKIRESAHFRNACHKVLQLRRELAAAEDYERLSSRARALRHTLEVAPIVATSDPLSEAFEATLGRRLGIEGRAGVAVLVTIVVEIMSSCGLAALGAPRNRSSPKEDAAKPRAPAAGEVPHNPRRPRRRKLSAKERGVAIASKIPARPRKSRARRCVESRTGSGDAACSRSAAGRRQQARSRPPSPRARIADRPASRAVEPRRRTSRRQSTGSPGRRACACNVADFVRERLEGAEGASISAAELRVAYPSWCAAAGRDPVSYHRLGSELRKLGLAKWKSNGRIRYRDLRLRA